MEGYIQTLSDGKIKESGYHSYSTFSTAFKQRMHKNVTDWMREEVLNHI
jgi:AraC-like DNA-binding protein